MKLSKNIIKAIATEDMYSWIMDYKKGKNLKFLDKETEDTYWNYINKMKERILKEL